MPTSTTATEILHWLKSLRAVRNFTSQEVTESVLRDILEVARWCGSSKNTQYWRFIVIRDKASLAKLARLGEFAGHLAGADLAIGIAMRKDEEYDASFDAGRVAQAMMLGANAHGVGSCIAFLVPAGNEALAREILGVPDTYHLRAAVSFGYGARKRAFQVPGWPPREAVLPMLGRLPLSQLVSYEQFGQSQPLT